MFEAAGLATVAIVPIRNVAERMRPPRALAVEFPLGLPLGKPGDADFQHRVLDAAFALFEKPTPPVLEDFPEAIRSGDSEPLVCSLPPRYDPELHPAVDEAQGLRAAYDRAVARQGRTTVGSHASADDIPDAIGKFARIASGEPWDQGGLRRLGRPDRGGDQDVLRGTRLRTGGRSRRTLGGGALVLRAYGDGQGVAGRAAQDA